MDTDYNTPVKEFLQRTNTTFSIRFLYKDYNCSCDKKHPHNKYIVTLKNEKHKASFVFWDSVVNTEKPDRKNPSEYTTLSCLQKYDVGTFEDFCSEFGYEYYNKTEERKVKSIYNAVVKEYDKMSKLFTEDELQELSEIAY